MILDPGKSILGVDKSALLLIPYTPIDFKSSTILDTVTNHVNKCCIFDYITIHY